jgi:hypothetical protein
MLLLSHGFVHDGAKARSQTLCAFQSHDQCNFTLYYIQVCTASWA